MDRKILREKRKRRIRKVISGSMERPRLCIFISLKDIYVQAIDDKKGNTIASADLKEAKAKNNMEKRKKSRKGIRRKKKKKRK